MTPINLIELVAALPEDVRPAAFAAALHQTPGYWHAFRPQGDPELRAFYPKTKTAMAMERKEGRGPKFHVLDGKVYYTLYDIHEYLTANPTERAKLDRLRDAAYTKLKRKTVRLW